MTNRPLARDLHCQRGMKQTTFSGGATMRRTHKRLTRSLLVALGALSLVACGGEGDVSSPDLVEHVDPDRSHNIKFKELASRGLGINKNLGPRKNPAGKVLSATYHPLTKRYRTLAPLSELYHAGIEYQGKLQGLLNDLKNSDLDRLHSDSDDTWAKRRLTASKGDVDGDGIEEVVVLVNDHSTQTLELKVVDRSGGEFHTRSTTVATGVFGHLLRVKLADLDNDGRDEVITVVDSVVRIFDDVKGNHAKLASKSYPGAFLQLGVGDFYGDGLDRLLVLRYNAECTKHTGWICTQQVYSLRYHLYDGCLASERLTQELKHDGKPMRNVWLAVGDIDGDGLDEVALHAGPYGGGKLLLMDDLRAGGQWLGATAKVSGHHVTLLDADGDGVKEILAGKTLFDYSATSQKLTELGSLPFDLPHSHTTGDLDGDHREDLVAYSGGALQFFGLKNKALALFKKVGAAGNAAHSHALVAANVDEDSVLVRYTGQNMLKFSRPQIIAAMAAPPTYKGIGQNVDGSGTTFGKKQGLETEASASVGVSVGISVGAKAGLKILGNGVEVQSKTTYRASMNWTAMAFASIETSYAFSSGPEEDKVVFTSVPFDVYYYEVVSSPNPKDVGQVISINLPREPQTFSVTREFYNAHNGDAPDVDASVMGHAVGDPWSYPTRDERNAIIGAGLIKTGWLNPKMVTVGQGGGLQTLTIDATAGLGAGIESEFSVEKEAEVTAGPVVLGASAEFSVGVGLSVKAYQGFFIEGSVGDIPAEHYKAERLYRAGLFAYNHKASDDDQFLVINYWVEK
jgi:hypothetical protein